MLGEESVCSSPEGVGEPGAPGWVVERLHLDEKLVDHTTGSFRHRRSVEARIACRGAVHASAPTADGVELFDESDGPAFLAGNLSEAAEVGANLASCGPVPHALEGGRRHEQKRHPGLSGQRLRSMGLACPRGPFEEDPASRLATHLVAEPLMVEKDVERVAYLRQNRS